MPGGDASSQRSSGNAEGGRFGWFAGVYTPSILTILGVIMYLRLGWVTGQAGLGVALAIVVIAHLISLSTGLSVASIATNRTVGAGGAYFMISRALGAPAGAAIGIPLFLAEALSVTFYIVGFTESVMQLLPESLHAHVPPIAISTSVNVLVAALSLKSSELAIKAQFFVMAAIAASLVAFFTGQMPEFPVAIEWVNRDGADFATIFAVFFPAVTGLTAGVSMSGDLKDPRRAIPLGTLLAIATGFVIYAAFPIWFSLNMTNDELVGSLDAAFVIGSVPALIYAGVWGATLSSALGCLMTAPRTLQALATDGLAPKLFAKGYGPDAEPRAGVVLTFLLAQAGIFLGSIDVIAPVLTMFFLATYGVTNLASGLERWAASPSFRPTFRVPALVSLGGAAGCFYVMSIIDTRAMVASLIVCALIYGIAQRRTLGATYGDARHGIWAALVRSALHRLRRSEFHPQNWRPNLIMLGDDSAPRAHLIELGSALVQDRGVVTYFDILEGTDVGALAAERRKRFEEHEPRLRDEHPNVFYRVDIADSLYDGALAAAQSYGVGNFEANAVMLAWNRAPEQAARFVRTLRDLSELDRALLLLNHVAERVPDGETKRERRRRERRQRQVHVWLLDPPAAGAGAGETRALDRRTHALSLLLAFLLTSDPRWHNSRITVFKPAGSDDARELVRGELASLLAQARIDARARVVLRQDRTIPELMCAEGTGCDLAVVSLSLPSKDEPAAPFVEDVDAILAELPTTLLVHGAKSFGGEHILK